MNPEEQPRSERGKQHAGTHRQPDEQHISGEIPAPAPALPLAPGFPPGQHPGAGGPSRPAPPSHGSYAWALGFLSYIPFPLISIIITVIAQGIAYRQLRKSPNPAAVHNGRAACNWGLTLLAHHLALLLIAVLMSLIPPLDIHALTVLSLTVLHLCLGWFLLLGPIHFFITLFGIIRSSTGAVFKPRIIISFIRTPDSEPDPDLLGPHMERFRAQARSAANAPGDPAAHTPRETRPVAPHPAAPHPAAPHPAAPHPAAPHPTAGTDYPHPEQPSIPAESGAGTWRLGLLSLIPVPLLSTIITAIAKARAHARLRASANDLAAWNARNALNWALSCLLLQLLAIVLGLTLSGPGSTHPQNGIMVAITQGMAWIYVLNWLQLPIALVGAAQASKGRIFKAPAIPFIRVPSPRPSTRQITTTIPPQ